MQLRCAEDRPPGRKGSNHFRASSKSFSMKIRQANANDADAIYNLNLLAFDPTEAEPVANLAKDLLLTPAEMGVHTWVAEEAGAVIGHVAFSPVHHRDTKAQVGQNLAPLSTHPDHQKQGVAAQLVHTGIEHFRLAGTELILVYGDPNYYGRFGCKAEVAEPYLPPHPIKYPFGWLGMRLNASESPSGTVPITCVPPLDKPALW